MLNQTREHASEILAKDSQDNATSTATATEGTNQTRYYITGVNASYSVAGTSGLLQLKDDTTVIWEQYIHGSADIHFPSAILGSKEKSVSAVLAASGTLGEIGKVNLIGYLSY